MPRLRSVVLTAALAALVLAVWLSLHGGDQDAAAPDIRRQLALEQQRREAAQRARRGIEESCTRFVGECVGEMRRQTAQLCSEMLAS